MAKRWKIYTIRDGRGRHYEICRRVSDTTRICRFRTKYKVVAKKKLKEIKKT